MNIEFSKKEYRDLLDILHIAEVILSRHRKGEDRRTESHRALMQKLYVFAKREGFGDLIQYDEMALKFKATPDFEQSTMAHVVIDEFGEHIFWDHLINSLAIRDAAQAAGGIDRLNEMSDMERQFVEEPIRQHYREEFAANGVSNLEVIEKLGSSEALPLKTSD